MRESMDYVLKWKQKNPLLFSLDFFSSFDISVLSVELNANLPTESEWSLVYTGEDMGKKTEHRAIFNEPIVMSPLEKRCFLIYKTHSCSACALEVFDWAWTVEDENVLFHGSRWITAHTIGEGIPPFVRGSYTLNGGLIYDLSCGLKPAKR